MSAHSHKLLSHWVREAMCLWDFIMGLFSLLVKDLISDFYLPSLQLVSSPHTSTIVQFIFYFCPLRSVRIF